MKNHSIASLEHDKAEIAQHSDGLFIKTIRSVLKQVGGFIGIVLFLSLLLVATFAPLLTTHDPLVQQAGAQLLPPSQAHFMGTDEFGRDIYSRVIIGTRISVLVSVGAVSLGATIGVIIGLLSGYFGGMLDTLFMRFVDVLLAYPGILFGIIVVTILGPGLTQVAIAIAIINIPIFARLARMSALKERELEYVLAAICIGAGSMRIIFKEILPNALSSLFVQLSISMGLAVLLEASLSFLGLGVQAPQPSLGSMLNDSRAYLRDAAFYGIFPGLFLTVLVISLNLLGDALRRALDPRMTSITS